LKGSPSHHTLSPFDRSKHPLLPNHPFFEKVKNKVRNDEVYNEFLKCLNLFNKDIATRDELLELVDEVLKEYPELVEGLRRILFPQKPTPAEMEMEEEEAPPQVATTRLTDLVNDKCRQATPSYKALPDNIRNCVRLKCSGRTALCDETLNDMWVSVPTGSEDYFSFKHSRKNVYEEALFRVEDEQFELDACIENNATSVRALELISIKMSHMSEEERQAYELDAEMLRACNVRSIRRIYVDRGKEVVEHLRQHPVLSVPVLLERLKNKHEEWVRLRRETVKSWEGVQERNALKSLDHRSFYFKQLDKRTVGTRVLLGEIIPGEEQKADPAEDGEGEGAAQDQPAATGTIRFTLPDPSIHADVYNVIGYYVEHTMVDRDERKKVLSFWKSFVEDFFCAPFDSENGPSSQPHSPASSKEASQNPQSSPAPTPAVPAQSSDSEQSLSNLKSVGPSSRRRNIRRLFFGENKFYLFFRLYQILYGRMLKAKEMSKRDDEKQFRSVVKQQPPQSIRQASPVPTSASASAPPLAPSASSVPDSSSSDAVQTTTAAAVVDAMEVDVTTATATTVTTTTTAATATAASVVSVQSQVVVANHIADDKDSSSQEVADANSNSQSAIGTGATTANVPPSSVSAPAVPAPSPTPSTISASASLSTEDRYAAFVKMLKQLLDGTIDAVRYEDECRPLLGTSSYVLFTLDKLIFKLVKAVPLLYTMESAVQLVNYNRSYRSGTGADGCTDLEYQDRAMKLLETDNCFRIELLQEGRELVIHLMTGQEDEDMAGLTPEDRWFQYLHTYLDPKHDPSLDNSKRAVFLRRVLRRCKKLILKAEKREKRFAQQQRDANPSATPVPAPASRTRPLRVNYGLELRPRALDSQSFRLSFAEGTSDYLYRVGSRRKVWALVCLVCMFEWMDVCVLPCPHTYIHTYIHTHTYTHTYVKTHIHTHTYIHTCNPTLSQIAVRPATMSHQHTYIQTYIHSYNPTLSQLAVRPATMDHQHKHI